jgi:hypothetical protein
VTLAVLLATLAGSVLAALMLLTGLTLAALLLLAWFVLPALLRVLLWIVLLLLRVALRILLVRHAALSSGVGPGRQTDNPPQLARFLLMVVQFAAKAWKIRRKKEQRRFASRRGFIHTRRQASALRAATGLLRVQSGRVWNRREAQRDAWTTSSSSLSTALRSVRSTA